MNTILFLSKCQCGDLSQSREELSQVWAFVIATIIFGASYTCTSFIGGILLSCAQGGT